MTCEADFPVACSRLLMPAGLALVPVFDKDLAADLLGADILLAFGFALPGPLLFDIGATGYLQLVVMFNVWIHGVVALTTLTSWNPLLRAIPPCVYGI